LLQQHITAKEEIAGLNLGFKQIDWVRLPSNISREISASTVKGSQIPV